MSVYNDLDSLINRGGTRAAAADALEGDGMGRYMAARWISMTSPKNAVVMSMFNTYSGADTVGELCGVASLFCGRYGRFTYLKKGKGRKVIRETDEEWPDRFSKREREWISSQLEWYEGRNKKKRKSSSKDGKKEQDKAG